MLKAGDPSFMAFATWLVVNRAGDAMRHGRRLTQYIDRPRMGGHSGRRAGAGDGSPAPPAGGGRERRAAPPPPLRRAFSPPDDVDRVGRPLILVRVEAASV